MSGDLESRIASVIDDATTPPIVAALLREALAVLREKEAAERRLVYGQEASALVAHDLNNGLTVSLNNLSFVLDVVKDNADVIDALTASLRSVRRMASLVANFVDIARFEDAEVKPMAERTSVRALLQSVIEVNSSAITRGAKLEIDCPHDLRGRFDSSLVERMLHNLFGNSTRYVNANGRIILEARRWTEPDGVEITVTNTGPQIPDTLRANLFGKYVQGQGGKRGMGLYFCRLVAEAHGGSIECEARSEGPCFIVRLPGRT